MYQSGHQGYMTDSAPDEASQVSITLSDSFYPSPDNISTTLVPPVPAKFEKYMTMIQLLFVIPFLMLQVMLSS